MSAFMRECDSGIWFNEEDPEDESYKPECCTNVYLDNACGKFDIIDCKTNYINNNNDDLQYYKKFNKYLEILEDNLNLPSKDEDYDADNETWC